MGDYGCGVICHDGSYKLFKWDASIGCMAPLMMRQTMSEPISTRLKCWLFSKFEGQIDALITERILLYHWRQTSRPIRTISMQKTNPQERQNEESQDFQSHEGI